MAEGRSIDEGFCKFGNLTVALDGELNAMEGTGTCKCVSPPYMECVSEDN